MSLKVSISKIGTTISRKKSLKSVDSMRKHHLKADKQIGRKLLLDAALLLLGVFAVTWSVDRSNMREIAQKQDKIKKYVSKHRYQVLADSIANLNVGTSDQSDVWSSVLKKVKAAAYKDSLKAVGAKEALRKINIDSIKAVGVREYLESVCKLNNIKIKRP
jgi:hypothetical protein